MSLDCGRQYTETTSADTGRRQTEKHLSSEGGDSNPQTFWLWGHSANRRSGSLKFNQGCDCSDKSCESPPPPFASSGHERQNDRNQQEKQNCIHHSTARSPRSASVAPKNPQKNPICLLQLKGSFVQKKKKKAIKKTNKTKIQSIFTVLFRLFDGEQRERMSLPEGEAKPKYILSAFSLFGRGWDENFYPLPGQGYEFHVQETRKQLLSWASRCRLVHL